MIIPEERLEVGAASTAEDIASTRVARSNEKENPSCMVNIRLASSKDVTVKL